MVGGRRDIERENREDRAELAQERKIRTNNTRVENQPSQPESARTPLSSDPDPAQDYERRLVNASRTQANDDQGGSGNFEAPSSSRTTARQLIRNDKPMTADRDTPERAAAPERVSDAPASGGLSSDNDLPTIADGNGSSNPFPAGVLSKTPIPLAGVAVSAAQKKAVNTILKGPGDRGVIGSANSAADAAAASAPAGGFMGWLSGLWTSIKGIGASVLGWVKGPSGMQGIGKCISSNNWIGIFSVPLVQAALVTGGTLAAFTLIKKLFRGKAERNKAKIMAAMQQMKAKA
jgi:hypothetical protein